MFFVLAAIIVAGLGGYLLYLDARRKRAQVADDSELYDDSAQDHGPDPIEPAGDEAEAFADHHDFDVGQGPVRETDYGQPVSSKPAARPAQPASRRGSAYGPNSGRSNLPNQSNQQPGRSSQSGGQAGQQNQPGQPGQRRPRPAAQRPTPQSVPPQQPAAPERQPFTITKTPHITRPTGARGTTGVAGSGGEAGADHDADSHDEEPGGSGGLGGGVGGHESPDTTTTTGQAQQPAAQSDASVVPAAREKKTVAPPMVLPSAHARLPKSAFTGLLRSATRARRNWAQEHEFEYQKEDPYLSDEWSHGFASSNLTAKDVVSGFAAGYELWLVDLGQVTVMAMRRKATSNVVIDIRRILQSDTYKFENLVSVTTFQGFHVFSNNPGAAQRFIDDRVGTAFATMPAKVTAMWLESSWVLAATPKGSVEEDWDAMIQPLALLADAAYVLPPAPGAMPPISYQDSDPTRVLPQAPELPEDEDEPEVTPPMPQLRPKEEPVVLPSRVREESRGSVNSRQVGMDDVSPIADGGKPADPNDYFGTRVIRDTSQGPSIFTDGKQKD